MLSRLLALRSGELPRILPFFAVYALLFAALSVADGLSLALFVQRVGTGWLPAAYAVAAAVNLTAIGLYLSQVDRRSSRVLLHAILFAIAALMLAAWVGLRWFGGGLAWCGLLFVLRETAYTLVLMHFGTYLQERFRPRASGPRSDNTAREALNRALPIVYAGGRLGGIAGGWLLATLASPLGMANLLLVVALLAVAACLAERLLTIPAPAMRAGVSGLESVAAPESEDPACHSARAFLSLVWRSPLLFWITVGSVVFVVCRWVLNYQYNQAFEEHFDGDVVLAQFLGRYTQLALTLSLVVQLLVVNRLLTWIGVGGTHLLYAALVFIALVAAWLMPGLAAAVLARLVETELRFALRNPAAQWLTNVFSRPLRIRVRAWSLGLLIPVGTLLAAVLLAAIDRLGGAEAIAIAGVVVGLTYFLSSCALAGQVTQPAADAPTDAGLGEQRDNDIPASAAPSISPLPLAR